LAARITRSRARQGSLRVIRGCRRFNSLDNEKRFRPFRWLTRLADFFRVFPSARVLGRRGEKLAARYLRRCGYKIIDRNVQFSGGELDLVAVDNQSLVIVEVKTRRSRGTRSPALAVTRAKQTRICRAAREFIREHRLKKSTVRFDIIAITWPDDERPQVEHQTDAFPWRVARDLGTPIIPHMYRSTKPGSQRDHR
jgi:putative endonuclease